MKKNEPMIHMIHVPSGKVGVVPQSRTAEAEHSGFEYIGLMKHKDGRHGWVRRSKLREAKKQGFVHAHVALENEKEGFGPIHTIKEISL